jgi:hypothetical protein
MVATPRSHGNTNVMRAHANPAVSSPSDVTSHRHFEPRSDHGGINSEAAVVKRCHRSHQRREGSGREVSSGWLPRKWQQQWQAKAQAGEAERD